jgi:hypothetical protein
MRDNEKTLKHTEVSLFYSSIQQKYLELMEELMQKDCQRVEFIRGALSVYSEILNQKKHWEEKSNYSYFK